MWAGEEDDARFNFNYHKHKVPPSKMKNGNYVVCGEKVGFINEEIELVKSRLLQLQILSRLRCAAHWEMDAVSRT